jgi:DNA polymerase (family 10)
LAKDKGIKINEYGLETVTGEKLSVADEKQLYGWLGLEYIEPELREGTDELEQSAAGKLPKLVEKADIRGILHVHTTYSDGGATLGAMAQAIEERGWSYGGITDHSQIAVYARGLKVEKLKEQRQEINRLNAAGGKIQLLASIECDILADGSLDYPDEILAQFDFVIASVHSAFRQSQSDMTQRILRAMTNPYVSILGHPTGRILLARESYALDIPAVLKGAADTGTIVEINASPYRLDLDWRWCRGAKEMGILFAINPDAHAIEELDNVAFGVGIARKGWLTAGDIVNTRPVDQAVQLLRRKRN